MIALLVNYYNLIIKHCFYPSRWMKILDIVIEKGKELILGKLRIIQLIEADLQLLIRIFMGSRNEDLIEKDHRISKSNFESRKYYSIETVILKKRLLYDTSIISRETIVYNLTDL